MTNILVLNQSNLLWCGRVIGVFTLQGLHTGHFVIGYDKFAFFQEFSGSPIEFIDKLAFDVKLFIFRPIQPILTLVRTN